MEFEWDERKARTNLRRHRIDFADAATVFEDHRAVTVTDEYADEERYATIGMDALGLLDTLIIDYRRGELQLRMRGY